MFSYFINITYTTSCKCYKTACVQLPPSTFSHTPQAVHPALGIILSHSVRFDADIINKVNLFERGNLFIYYLLLCKKIQPSVSDLMERQKTHEYP